ncbi:MAG: ArgE/DapE family deacylase [Phycisphaerae bacterium]|nr:ArgE/DapE family deacylase [Phycisphaerae bacterium]
METLNKAQKGEVVQLLKELVAIDSSQMPGKERVEEEMASYVTHYCKAMGMTVDKQEVAPGRPNLMAHWPEQTGSKSLMLEAHMDTVTVEGMTVDPFAGKIRDGKILGRGTCDTKGTMAAFLTALRIAGERGQLPADKLYFVAVMDEETCCEGAKELMKTDFRTDAAIVGEPTRCELVTCHKGPLWFEVETRGRACHPSLPEKGRNAIDEMARLVSFVHGAYTEHIQHKSHPLLGRSTAQVTVIEGGTRINIIPERCRAKIDGRYIPGQSLDEIKTEFERMARQQLGPEASFHIVSTKGFLPLDSPVESPLVRKLQKVIRQAGGSGKPQGVNYFADTGPFTAGGIASVIFGSGDIAQAHTADEYLELDQLYRATEVILTLLTQNVGRSILGE